MEREKYSYDEFVANSSLPVGGGPVEDAGKFEHLGVKRTFCIGSRSQFGVQSVPSFIFALFNSPSK